MTIFTRQKIMPDIKEFMTTEEAAEVLGFTLQGVSKLIRQGKLEATKKGNMYLVLRKSVKDYLKKTEGMSKNDPRRKNKSDG
ncbi:MAG: helix-turn-helix domain-containing protein [Anaerolineales bacterium]|nr:helix-turn-helix domain-containing protein [Anaerolineales bacterium]